MNIPKQKGCTWIAATTAALLFSGSQRSFADITVTAEAPGVQSTQMKNAQTMDFNAPTYQAGQYTKLQTTIGTYTASGKGFAIVSPSVGNNSAWGGASTTGLPGPTQTQYAAIGAESGQTSMTLSLKGAASYFGMYWAAGDPGNQLLFYMGNTLLAKYTVNDVMKFLGGNSAYMGNPNNKQDSSEPFVYLNFYADASTQFDRIVFQNASTGSGFETDNHSILFASQGGSGSVGMSGKVVGNISTAPEPSSLITACVGVVAFLLRQRARSLCGLIQRHAAFRSSQRRG